MTDYIYWAIGVIAIAYITYCNTQIDSLEKEVKYLNAKLITSTTNNLTLRGSISSQNEKIEKYELDIQSKEKELLEWQNKPAKVKYETIYKEIVRDNNLTGECDEVKSIINSIPNINLNSL